VKHKCDNENNETAKSHTRDDTKDFPRLCFATEDRVREEEEEENGVGVRERRRSSV
jgi:hypothetical protein